MSRAAPGAAAAMKMLSIDTLKAVQRDVALLDVHLVHVGDVGFTIAHTDEERASGESLESCALHRWLLGQDGPPEAPGIYVVTPHEVDAYSEPYPVAEWDFHPLKEATVIRANNACRSCGVTLTAHESGRCAVCYGHESGPSSDLQW